MNQQAVIPLAINNGTRIIGSTNVVRYRLKNEHHRTIEQVMGTEDEIQFLVDTHLRHHWIPPVLAADGKTILVDGYLDARGKADWFEQFTINVTR